MHFSRTIIQCSLLASTTLLTPASAVNCTRESLLQAAALFTTSLSAGTLLTSPLLLPTTTYQENNKPLSLSKSIYTSPLPLSLNRSTADTQTCTTYTMAISLSPKPYVLATQLHYSPNDTSKLTSIDTIAATTGALFFNASLTLSYIKAEDWSPLTLASQPSRAVLQKAGDAYLDMWTDAKAADTIPWGTDCERVEGSMLTKPCGKSLPRGGSKVVNGMRRYVIDEVVGSVDVLCAFSSLGDLPDSHEIRVVDGKVKYVHTVTVVNKLNR